MSGYQEKNLKCSARLKTQFQSTEHTLEQLLNIAKMIESSKWKFKIKNILGWPKSTFSFFLKIKDTFFKVNIDMTTVTIQS